MTVAEILKYFLMAIPALSALGVLGALIAGRNTNILDRVKKGLPRLRKRGAVIILFVLLYFTGYLGMKQIKLYTEGAVVLGFHYPEASRGLNPNKTRFNASEILSDRVLETAVENGGFSVTPEELRKSLRVEPVKAGDYISVDKYYISTEYALKYEATKDTLHLDPVLVVDMVSHAYYEIFIGEYARNTSLLNIDGAEFSGHEYQELTEIFDIRAGNIQTYAAMCAKESSSFRSKKNGETFSSIEKKIKNFRDVQLERYEAFVRKHGLTKDKSNYLAKINYQNRILNKDYMKNLSYYQVRLDAIDMYERDIATIVEVPTYNNDGEFYMSRTKIGVDQFADEAEVFLQRASNLQLKIETNDDVISGIHKGANDGDVYSQADMMVDSMVSEVKTLANLLRDTLEEYNTGITRDYLSITIQEQHFLEKYGVKKGVLASIVTGIILCVLMIVFPEKTGGNK